MKCVEPEDILFGGTFDPPHLGHRELLESALKRFNKAHLFVCPAAEPPSTVKDPKAAKASFEDRMAMCRLNFPETERVTVSDFEKHLPAPNYTVNSLRAWVKQSSRPVAILMGADQMMNFAHWREPAEILKLAAIVVSPRETFPMGRSDLLEVLKTFDAEVVWNEKSACFCARSFTGGGVFLLAQVPQAAASRDVRQRYEDGNEQYNSMLAPAVSAYIHEHNLYRQV